MYFPNVVKNHFLFVSMYLMPKHAVDSFGLTVDQIITYDEGMDNLIGLSCSMVIMKLIISFLYRVDFIYTCRSDVDSALGLCFVCICWAVENMPASDFAIACVKQKWAPFLGILDAFVWLLLLLVVCVVPGFVPMDLVIFHRLIFPV